MEDIATQMKKAWDAEMDKFRPQMLQLCQKQCELLFEAAYKQIETYGVTGNLFNSLIVGCYEKGRLLCTHSASTKGVKRETRSTLKRGERYNLPTYWSGGSAKKGAYVGKTGSDNYIGRDRAMSFITNVRSNKSVPYRFVIGVAVEYAKYAETKSGKNVLTRLHDELQRAGADVSRMWNK